MPYLDATLFDQDAPWLDAQQVDDLVVFLEQGLTDRALRAAHSPDALSLSGYCSINNDPLSRATTPGCEHAREP